VIQENQLFAATDDIFFCIVQSLHAARKYLDVHAFMH